MNPGEDHGNLGNLVAYLSGKDSLEDRLKKATQIFFIPLSIPPQHKEEVVILWIADIVSTSKVHAYTLEERELTWKYLRKILTSRRLQVLCSHRWVCPLTSTFIQTLVTIVSETSEATSIREEAFFICERFMNSPHLSPQVAHLSSHTLSLCTSMLVWANKEILCSTLTSFLSLLLQKAHNILNYKLSPQKALIYVYDKIMQLLLKLAISLQKNPDKQREELLLEIKNFLKYTVFGNNFHDLYRKLLECPLHKESKTPWSKEGESFYIFILNCIRHTDNDIAVDILKEFACCFFNAYKSSAAISCQFLINVTHLLGVSLKDKPSIKEENRAANTLVTAHLPRVYQDRFILAILEVLLNSNFYENAVLELVPLKKWIENLGIYFLKERNLTEDTLTCLSIIAKIEPMFLINFPTLFSDLLVCSRTMNGTCLMLDNLLCDVLNIHVKLRTLDVLYEKLSQNLLNLNLEDLWEDVSFHEAWLTYEGKHLLPINFVRKLVASIKSMGTQMLLNFWDTVVKVLSKICHEALQQENSSERVSIIALMVWFAALCLSATPFVEMASVSGVATKVSRTMNILAKDGIRPLVLDMLALSKGKPVLARSLMSLMLVWSEFHAALLSTETGYKDQTTFPWKPIWECESPKDFSSQIPFLNSEIWREILSTCLNEDEDGCRFWIVQMLVQKVVLIEAQTVEHKAHGMPFDDFVTKCLRDQCLRCIFDGRDTSTFPLSTDLVAFHLPSLAPLLKIWQWNQIAGMFILGIEEDRKAWIELGKSSFFQDCGNLHSCCFSLLCNRISVLLSGSKRKRDEEELEKINSKCILKYLSKKVILKRKLQSKANVKGSKFCLKYLDALLKFPKRNKSVGRLAKRSQREVSNLLRVLEMYPLALLNLNFTLSMIVFLLVVLVEEGGLNGRQEVILWVLHLLNRTVASPHVISLFMLPKKSYFILMWLVSESEQLLENFAEDNHLKIILEGEEPTVQNPAGTGELVGELVYLINAITRSYLMWNTRAGVLSYAKSLTCKDGEDVKVNEKNGLPLLMLVVHLRKKIEMLEKLNRQWVAVLKMLGQWSLTVSQVMKLSDVTNVLLANCLTVFSSLLFASEKLNEPMPSQRELQKGRHDSTQALSKTKKTKNEDETNCDPSVLEFKALDWEVMISSGVRFAELLSNEENKQLKKLCFSFFLGVASSSRVFASLDRRNAFRKALSCINFGEDFDDVHAVHSLFKSLSHEYYRQLLRILLQEIQTTPFESRTLAQWLIVVTAEPPKPALLKIKSEAEEQLLSVLCMQIACQDVDQNICLDISIKVLEAVLKTNGNLSSHSKALVLNVFPKVLSLTRSSSFLEFVKVFESSVQLLYQFLRSEHYYIVSDRSVSVMSAVTQLSFEIMERADESYHHLSENIVTEIQRCSSEVEKIVRELRKFAFAFSKIIPFSLVKIVQKIQQTQLCPVIKESLERVVYNLLDWSDIYCLKHLMVTLPPSVTTLLKYYYDAFTHNFQFNPQTA